MGLPTPGFELAISTRISTNFLRAVTASWPCA
jgi:hypothetical protein